MYCPNCGQQNADDSKFCQSCGTSLTEPVEVADTPSPPAAISPFPASTTIPQPVTTVQRTSGMAVASLVLGIASFPLYFLAIITGPLAIIFGAVSIGQINREPELGGKGMAMAGLVLGIVTIVLWILVIVFASSMFWVFGEF